MTKEQLPINKGKVQKPSTKTSEKKPAKERRGQTSAITRLQQQVGNRALQRLIAQRSSQEPADLDNETTSRINQARGGGQSLDEGTQEQMGSAMGHDFSDVRVHTSAESNQLNRELGAQAFTTGKDVFFSEGSYDPNTSGGQELIAHELTHVVQQGSGQVGSDSGRMTVNAPGDAYEQQADAVANEVKTSQNAGVQRQDEDELMMQRIQRQEDEDEGEEYVMTKPVQRQEEDELMMQRIQRQEDEDEGEEYVMTKPVQRQEEEELMMKPVQRQEEEEEMMMPKLQRQEEEEAME